jgi:hypothetical protein
VKKHSTTDRYSEVGWYGGVVEGERRQRVSKKECAKGIHYVSGVSFK